MTSSQTNGFPSGEFRIVEMDSGLCLTTKPGIVSKTSGSQDYNEIHGMATQTGDPSVEVLAVTGEPRQRWYTDGALLINTVKEDVRGSFALRIKADPMNFGPGDDGPEVVAMVGAGSIYAAHLQTEDGYIYQEGEPEQVITYAPGNAGMLRKAELIMAPRGGEHQRWRFEPGT
ncbi:hypothetical protein VMT65_38085 [Nocardia sp. CDC153]|uniref:hypothetical protein n=1 Tax=Nocardia sp. CDC153 TaxID=3112167 RepID=UPI002DB728E9|nr:hypothetical protein [Nocardia sp. CDC153]MEC3958896.1 hypothetical protein [Nocardia sp. CDC153]